MFENSSEKIKNASKILFYLALASATILLILGFVMIAKSEDCYHDYFLGKYYEYGSDLEEVGYMYVLYSIILVPMSYISSLLMYGFAELLENSIANKQKTEKANITPTESTKTDVLDNLLANGLITLEEYEEKKNSIS